MAISTVSSLYFPSFKINSNVPISGLGTWLSSEPKIVRLASPQVLVYFVLHWERNERSKKRKKI